ncbi:DNA helicase PcrA [Patescibacteria group bacterium]|nr:MAG: DNA helicase PcrA [Patescibacteria group bacterium]
MNLLSELNPKQKDAVLQTEGPVLIIAGAGSGKTRVLTHRLAYLIQEKKASPYEILAVTFTNKAAGEMKKRVYKLLGLPLDGRKMGIDPFVSTFHSFCAHLLRREIEKLGYSKNFVIYDQDDQLRLVKKVMKELDIDRGQFNPKSILAYISGAKNELIEPKKYQELANDFFQELTAKVYPVYQEKLKESSALDFDDLIMKTVELFEKYPKVLEKYQNRFRYVLIDEYQDTNHAQYRLVKLLADKHKNICVVGDPDQGIYSWRGANIQNILNFERDYPKAKIVKLEQNYRSTKNILAAAHEIIKRNIERKEKKLWTKNRNGAKVFLYEALDERDEGEFILGEVEKFLKKKEFDYSDCVILYRTNAQSRALEEVCLRFNIPYKIVGGISFYERAEIKDILAYLQLILNPNDEVAFERIINVPPRGIGQQTLRKIHQLKRGKGKSFLELLKSKDNLNRFKPKQKRALGKFAKLLGKFQKLALKKNVLLLIDEVLNRSGYADYLQDGTEEGEIRFENLQELKTVAKEYQDLKPEDSLRAFLEKVALITDIDHYNENEKALTLMTLHSAKGLEFPVVFIAGMEEGIFPHSRTFFDPSDLEEERRLCYVGVTRAKKHLYLICAQKRALWGDIQVNSRSRFLADVPEELISYISTGERENSFEDVENFLDGAETDFEVGDKVKHPKFGEGKIVEIKKDRIAIAFEGKGIKKVVAGLAPVKKI